MKKILVAVDMQNDFIDGALGTPEAMAIVPNVVEKIQNADDDTVVLFTKDTHFEDYLETQEGKNLPVEHCMFKAEEVNKGWQIHKSVRGAWLGKENAIILEHELMPNNDNTVLKGTFGATGLISVLASLFGDSKGANWEIELVGLCTDICVISNAMLLKTFSPEAKMSVDASCCAGVTPESHENALLAMEQCQIEIKR